MNLSRYLKETAVDLEIGRDLDLEPPDDEDEPTPRQLETAKKEVLRRIVGLLGQSDKVAKPQKLFDDLWNREKRATMALGKGVALPHVRTMQAKELVMAVGIARDGIPWTDAPDGEPVRVFFAMVAPPYEDKTYLRIYGAIGRLFEEQEDAVERLFEARSPGEVIRILGELWRDM
jgi:PTS system nitrogen regulatory IIA component